MWMLGKIVAFSFILPSLLGFHIIDIDSGTLGARAKTKEKEHLIKMTYGERKILEVSVVSKKAL